MGKQSSYHSWGRRITCFFNACTGQTESVLGLPSLAEVWRARLINPSLGRGVRPPGQKRVRAQSCTQESAPDVGMQSGCARQSIFHALGKPGWGPAARQIHEVARRILSKGAVGLFVGVALMKFALLL